MISPYNVLAAMEAARVYYGRDERPSTAEAEKVFARALELIPILRRPHPAIVDRALYPTWGPLDVNRGPAIAQTARRLRVQPLWQPIVALYLIHTEPAIVARARDAHATPTGSHWIDVTGTSAVTIYARLSEAADEALAGPKFFHPAGPAGRGGYVAGLAAVSPCVLGSFLIAAYEDGEIDANELGLTALLREADAELELAEGWWPAPGPYFNWPG